MNRYTPVPPIKDPPPPSKNNKKPPNNNNKKNVTNNKTVVDNNNKNKKMMSAGDEEEEERFDDLPEDFKLTGVGMEKIVQELNRRLKRLMSFEDFSSSECKQHFIYFNAAGHNYMYNKQSGEQFGKHLASSYFVEVFQKMWRAHLNSDLFEAESINEDLLYNMLVSIEVLWNMSDKSSDVCQKIIICDLHEDMFSNFLKSEVLSPSNFHLEFRIDIVQGILGTLHNTIGLQKSKDAREAFRACDGVNILQPYREAASYQMISCVALMIQSYLVNEEENEKINSGNAVFKLLVTILDCSIRKKPHKGLTFVPIEVVEVLNKLAANDSNKERIVECGALPYYVKLMHPSNFTPVEQGEAAHGIWMLSFNEKCKERVLAEPGCIAALRHLYENSSDERVHKKTEGALWILEGKATSITSPTNDHKDEGHVFISYQWDAKPTVLKVRDRLRSAGFKVWIDEDDMSGSVLEAMANAVERALVVLVCISQKYKDSPSCRTEAEYTFRLRKPIIPVRMQPGYYPDGWLGALAGSKLVFDCSVQTKYEDAIRNLIKELNGHNKTTTDQNDNIVSSKAPVTTTMLPSHEKSNPINAWKQKEIYEWLENNNLKNLQNMFSTFKGSTLLEYQVMRQDAPEAFFADLAKNNISLTDRLQLSRALRDLS